MPKIKQTEMSENYKELNRTSAAYRETNDCGVLSIAIACNVSYKDAHEALAKAGRKNRQGVYVNQITAAIRSLGFKTRNCDPREFISQYPANHKNLKSVTSHHPARFNKVWKNGKSYVMCSRSHALAIADGRTHDWSEGRSLRARFIFEIIAK